MSSLEEKLEHFNEVILKDAASERDSILMQIKSEMSEYIERKTAEIREEADEVLRKETALAEREKNNIISRAVIESKQLLMKTREAIIRSVLDEVKNRLESFVEGNDYFPYLADEIIRSCKLAGEGELVVYLKKSDMKRFSSRLDEIKDKLPPSVSFDAIDDAVIGGCRVLNRTKSILIDNTIDAKLEESKDGFFETCSLRID